MTATATARKKRAITSERVDPNKPASIVIDRFGGLTKFCDLTGYATSTAHGWTVSGYIPPKHHSFILAKAKEHRVRLAPADFVEKPAAPANDAGNGQ